jgi:phosphotransferase system HPr-like phosphotransfer protein
MPVASPSPGTATPTNTAPGTSGAAISTVADAQKVSSQVTDELKKLSEVSEATVVAAGDTAVVGLTFDSQYKGGMTTRISDMVKDRIKSINTTIKNVAVTDKQAQVKSISDLNRTLAATGTTLSTLKTQVDALYKTITGNTPSPSPT